MIGEPVPLIFQMDDPVLSAQGITFDSLKHLDAIGLISLETVSGYAKRGLELRSCFLLWPTNPHRILRKREEPTENRPCTADFDWNEVDIYMRTHSERSVLPSNNSELVKSRLILASVITKR